MYRQLNYPPFINGFYYPYANYMSTEPKKAMANIVGGPLASELKGIVIFTTLARGTQVTVEVSGLPMYKPATEGKAQVGPHGFHIHENGTCGIGNPAEPFSAVGATGTQLISPMVIMLEIFQFFLVTMAIQE